MANMAIARRIIIGIAAAVCFGAALAGNVGAQSAERRAPVAVARMDSPIDQLAADTLADWIETAQARSSPLLIVELDTPGGQLDSAREIAGMITDSPVPVAVLVTPSGARASSAGIFVLAAAHVAAMSRGTTVGAAAPVDSSGNDLSETLKQKASQSAAAFLRGLPNAQRRGPDAVQALERAIFEAAAYSAAEADELGVIDFIASDPYDLAAQADGKTVYVGGESRVLPIQDATLQDVPPSPVDDFMRWVANPQIVFILLAVGAVFIVIELASPGGWLAAFVGGVFIVSAIAGMLNLPANWFALILMLLGMGFFSAEMQSLGWGIFGAIGAVCFMLGGFLLFGDYATAPGIAAPAVRVGYWTLGGVAAFLALTLFGLWHFSRRARRIRVASKSSQIIGRVGTVRVSLDPKGSVLVASEMWSAESDTGEYIPAGESVIVSDVEGLTLKVFRESVIEPKDAANGE